MPLSRVEVSLEIHPRTAGPLAVVGKSPVLAARRVDANARGFTVDVGDLVVVGGGLSPGDCAKVESAVHDRLLERARHPKISFAADRVPDNLDVDALEVEGTLTLHGRSRPLRVALKRVSPLLFTAEVRLRQTDFGLVPITAFFGALRCEDELLVKCTVSISL